MTTRFFAATFLLATLNTFSQQIPMETPRDSVETLNEVVISANLLLGSKFHAQNRTGSAFYISAAELEQHNYTDINRVFNSVPGVNVYEEDGFGLRPNISLRGTSPERTSSITIMEDGVLIAPAPYSAPAAYYFPNVARMEAVEILKGSSQVQYGPFTTGGAINFISSQIPAEFSGSLLANYGSYNTSNLHVKAGNSHKNFGYLVEYQNYRSHGFKELDNGDNTGFDKDDFVAKLRVNTNPDASLGQELEFKFQYSDEVSDETYLGLTEGDFNIDPFDRYAASQKDQMNAEHLQFMLTHTLKFSEFFNITTTGYYNEFSRNWYKLNDVTANGQRVGLASLLENPGEYSQAYEIITGVANSQANALRVKNNNRVYTSKGVQTKFDRHFLTGEVFHDLEIGLRYHFDEEDRFQWIDGYDMMDGVMTLNTAGTPGTDANRISDARAFASFLLYKIKYNNWTITPGIRYENITLGRKDYGTTDLTRTGISLNERENQVEIFIPGVGFNYRFDNRISLFGGVHKGFSPPGNSVGEEPEESVNYELGTRFSLLGFNGELVGFYNDYSNLLGSDLAATGGTGTLDQFNAGEVEVKGVEVLLNSNLLRNYSTGFKIPLQFSYTYTHTEFKNSFASGADIWGTVTAGDEMPYIPNHQFFAGIGVENARFSVNINGRYRGAFRTMAGTGDIPDDEKIDSNFIVDLASKYHLNSHFSLTANFINLLDNEYAVSRVPSGLRPGHPFGAFVGIHARF